MPELVESINCPHCGGPLNLTTGEVIVTCPYCGSAVRIRSDKPFLLAHSMLPARLDRDGAMQAIAGWMEGGIMKPDDLRRASRVTALDGLYLPFYVFEVDADTTYQGVLTRTGTNERRSGNLVRNYFWKILGRRSGQSEVADYHIPLSLKVPFDTTQMLRDARLLNAEVDEDEAARLVQEQVDAHQRELLKDVVDVMENAKTQVTVKDSEFLHAPLWFATYEYRGKSYKIVVDAASGDVVQGDIPGPSGGFGEFLKDSTKGIFRR
ncbi:MAG TPA: zinc ribbon domain-containing protein [Thermoplasmata archaeon]|nr:zinc ribbon domain-containing protein [Thermoplasmata archaeon]